LESPFLNCLWPPVWSSRELQERALRKFRNLPCIQFYWEENFKVKVIGQPKIDLRDQALRHYFFARNILLWGNFLERGLFHARLAYKLDPQNAKIRELYKLYKKMSCQKFGYLKAKIILKLKGFFEARWREYVYKSLKLSIQI